MKSTLTQESLLEAYQKHPKTMLRYSYGEFVARWPWEWFVTLTFTYDVAPERAIKLFRVWQSQMNRALHGPNWFRRGRGVYWVLAIERTKAERVHLHALMSDMKHLRRMTWFDQWKELDKAAGYPQIWPIENLDAVSNYVTKYVAKDGELFFSPNLRAILGDLASPESGSLTNPRAEKPSSS
jgi:hypothetical protein